MLNLGAYAGLRRSEIQHLHANHITDLGIILRGKGDIERRVPIHARLRPYTNELRVTGGFAFPSPRDNGRPMSSSHVAHRMCDVLADPWTVHSLRHRFATQVLRACGNVRTVQQLLGHAKLETTMLYLAVVDEELDLAVAAVA